MTEQEWEAHPVVYEDGPIDAFEGRDNLWIAVVCLRHDAMAEGTSEDCEQSFLKIANWNRNLVFCFLNALGEIWKVVMDYPAPNMRPGSSISAENKTPYTRKSGSNLSAIYSETTRTEWTKL